jgi:hypothetical protein
LCHTSGIDEQHPVRLTVHDDLHRRRVTVLFRLILAIPHIVWFILWSILTLVLAFVGWIWALIAGQLPGELHRFFCAYIRYATHFFGYLYLVTEPYPSFGGRPITGYPLDVMLPDAPQPQRRLLVLVRFFVAIPALILSAALSGSGGSASFRSGRNGMSAAGNSIGGLVVFVAVLGWFASLWKGDMPRGLRDAGAYSLGYRAQATAYLLLVTEKYPNSDPHLLLAELAPPPLHPVRLEGDALDLRRSRLTVFFRLPLLIPLVVWGYLWSIPAGIAVFINWFALLVVGRPIGAFHRFVARFVRFEFHVSAFATVAANPFPGFTGTPGSYQLDLVLPGPARQSRWKTLFRLVLAIPAFILSIAFFGVVVVAAVLTWFAALFTARAPEGLRNLAAWGLRYFGQVNAYYNLLTDVYPHSSPLEGARTEPAEAAALDQAA